jgi:hypothetical protein
VILGGRRSQFGEEVTALIKKTIGIKASTEKETGNVLAIIHEAFEKAELITPTAMEPVATMALLEKPSNSTDDRTLKEQVAETTAFVH